MSDYQPAEGSLALRVTQYFRDRPDETLTRGQIARTFQVPNQGGIDSELMEAVRAGYLKRVQTDDGMCFTKGPGKLVWNPDLVTKAGKKPRRKPRFVDFTSLVFESDVPIPEMQQKISQWRTYLDRLEVGDCVKVPNDVRGSLAKAAATYRETREGWQFTIRRVDEQYTRMWRTA